MVKEDNSAGPETFSFEEAWQAHDKSELDRINAEGRRKELNKIKWLVMFRLGDELRLSATTAVRESYPGCSVQQRDAVIDVGLERYANFALDNRTGHEEDFNLAQDEIRDRVLRGLNARINTALEKEGAQYAIPVIRADEEVRPSGEIHLDGALNVIDEGRHTLEVISERQDGSGGMTRGRAGSNSKPVRPVGDGPPKSAG